jgi:alkylhydroperoxidase/carboxymuconolactone decarboxylase family protein YurZ
MIGWAGIRGRSVAGRLAWELASVDLVGRPLARKGGWALDYTNRLRRLAISDAQFAQDCVGDGGAGVVSGALDARTLALVRLAALVAVGGAVASYGAQADAAVDAGATAAEIVDVLVGVVPIVGLPRVVAAAPKLAMALGYDIDKALDQQYGV